MNGTETQTAWQVVRERMAHIYRCTPEEIDWWCHELRVEHGTYSFGFVIIWLDPKLALRPEHV